jgi:uncharacterized protein YodC (DUF2158 family)
VVQECIQVGDTVALKSGGPPMTVQALSMSLAYCAWSVGGQSRHGTFEVETLEFVAQAGRAGNGGPRSGS